MATGSRETFAKRQKERARQEKQREKIAKRQQRKSGKLNQNEGEDDLADAVSPDEAGLPEDENSPFPQQ